MQHSPDYSYNPAKAKEQLLKEAGYSKGLKLNLWTSNATERVRSAQFVKQQLGQVGIQVKVVPMDSGTRNAKLWSITDPKKAEFRFVLRRLVAFSRGCRLGVAAVVRNRVLDTNGLYVSYHM
ncbi:ABC transporter substrate-binding protein [Vibrio sp. PP-XX7]